MASRDIIFCGEPVLHKKAKRVAEVESSPVRLTVSAMSRADWSITR